MNLLAGRFRSGTEVDQAPRPVAPTDSHQPSPPYLVIILLIWCLVSVPGSVGRAWALEFPDQEGPVNDFAGILNPEDVSQLRDLAELVKRETGAALVTVTVEEFSEADLAQLTTELFTAWELGERSVLLVIAPDDKGFLLQAGTGLAGILDTDELTRIKNLYIIPHLDQGLFGPALLNGMRALARTIGREIGADLGPAAKPTVVGFKKKAAVSGIGAIILLAAMFLFLSRFRRRRRSARAPGQGVAHQLRQALRTGSGSGTGRMKGFGGGFGPFGSDH